MHEYDLAVVGILWGTALAFALAAVTMVDSGRKRLLITLWAIAAAFLVAAIAWPWAAEKWPALKTAAESIAANKIAINLIGTAIFALLVLDFGFRSGWFRKMKGHGTGENSGMIAQLGRDISGLRSEFDALGHTAIKTFRDTKDKLDRLEGAAPTAEDHNKLATVVVNLLNEHSELEPVLN
jgi:hypothetical protein